MRPDDGAEEEHDRHEGAEREIAGARAEPFAESVRRAACARTASKVESTA